MKSLSKHAWALALGLSLQALLSAPLARVSAALGEPPPNVFSPDARAQVTAINAPSKWIGKLILPGGGWCTAGLVARDLIVTAAHCIMDGTTKTFNKGSYQFLYGLINNRYADTSGTTWAWWGTTDPQANRGQDWAILRLSVALGDKYGWMGVRAMDLSQVLHQRFVGLTGYSSDFMSGTTAGVESACAFTGARSDGSFLHDCDMSRGASGAPMYRAETNAAGATVFYVVAVNVADYRDGKEQSLTGIPYSDGHANIAVPASKFIATLQSILAGPGLPRLFHVALQNVAL